MFLPICTCILPFIALCGVVRVRTGSRLHFGLLSIPPEESVPDTLELPRIRRYGGIGMMVDAPGVVVSVEQAEQWSAEGPLAERALRFARQVALAAPEKAVAPHRITVESCAPEHSGLGTGTQLGLALARALTTSAGLQPPAATELARLAGRGARSAIGIHGFNHGGVLVEAGKRTEEEISPLVASIPLPEEWRIVLIVPPWGAGLHGALETAAFTELRNSNPSSAVRDSLCRLILVDLLPALVEKDVHAFGRALYEFNRQSGIMFAPFQGGVYAQPRIAELIAFLRSKGVQGAAQSSWGPTVFAVVEGQRQALGLATSTQEQLGLSPADVIVVKPLNHGAEVTHNHSDSR
jgi:beta-ribofuranosylaminobenzene 5'-phosphate synthase